MSKHKKILYLCKRISEGTRNMDKRTDGKAHLLSTCISSLVNCKKAFVFDSLTGEANGNFLNS